MAEPSTITIKAQDMSPDDGQAAGTITPGELIELTGVSETEETFVPHSTSAAKTQVDVAIEGKAGKGIDQDYSDGEYMEKRTFLPGDEFYGFVFAGANASGTAPDVSSNANLAVGDLVVSYGDGTFRNFASSSDAQGAVLARATEAVDNSGGSTPARVVFEVV